MKRRDLIRHLEAHGCELLREGGKHSVYPGNGIRPLVVCGLPSYVFRMDSVTISDLLHLSLAERIHLAEDLWDSVAAEAEAAPERLPVTEAQRRELLRRSEAHRKSPCEAVPLEEALERIERSLE